MAKDVDPRTRALSSICMQIKDVSGCGLVGTIQGQGLSMQAGTISATNLMRLLATDYRPSLSGQNRTLACAWFFGDTPVVQCGGFDRLMGLDNAPQKNIDVMPKLNYDSAMNISAVDLFCGVGGLTHGLQTAGINVVAGIDADGTCAIPYEKNTKAAFLRKDLSQTSSSEIGRLFEENSIRLLAGCAPCQPFSSYGRTRKKEDDRWVLLRSFKRMIEDILPELVTMENVPGLLKHNVFQEFVTSLEDNGYHVVYNVISCEHYGLPQTRKRLILLASRLGEVEFPEPHREKPMTVRDAIAHLPPISAGETHPSDRYHAAATLNAINQERIKASKPGGTWRDWPEYLVARCHQQDTGKTYPGVYGRMEWNKPAPTITTQCYGYGNGRFGHPEQNRALSLREAALIQSFPEHWDFAGPEAPVQMVKIGRMIGNAVPPKIAEIVGKSFNKHAAQLAKQESPA